MQAGYLSDAFLRQRKAKTFAIAMHGRCNKMVATLQCWVTKLLSDAHCPLMRGLVVSSDQFALDSMYSQ